MATKNPLEELKNPKRTQVVIENLILSDLLSRAVIRDLGAKLKNYGDLVVGSLQIFLVPPKTKTTTKGQRVESLTFEQPSPAHFEAKKVIITATFSEVLDKILKP